MVRRASALFLLVTLTLAASADGQAPEPAWVLELNVDSAGVPIKPITSSANVPFEGRITCPTGSVPTLQPVTIVSSVATDVSWVTMVVFPSSLSIGFDAAECAAGATKTWNGTVTLSLLAQAPAFESFTITLSAVADGVDEVVSWEEEVAPYVRYEAEFEQTTFRAQPGEVVHVPLVVSNLGNAAVDVRASVMEGLTHADLSVEVFSSLVVGAFTGVGRGTVEVRVPEGALSQQYGFFVSVVPEVERDRAVQGASTELGGVVTASGPVVDELPAVGLPALLLFVAIAGLVGGRVGRPKLR